MTVIKATCNLGCGDVKTTSDEIVLRLQNGQEDGEAEYRFICPKCKKIVLKTCSWNIVAVLLDSKCKIERYDLPLELLERPKEEDAEPISLDDVIDLGLNLQQNEKGWMEKMVRGKNPDTDQP
jgi:hypothetical protein